MFMKEIFLFLIIPLANMFPAKISQSQEYYQLVSFFVKKKNNILIKDKIEAESCS